MENYTYNYESTNMTYSKDGFYYDPVNMAISKKCLVDILEILKTLGIFKGNTTFDISEKFPSGIPYSGDATKVVNDLITVDVYISAVQDSLDKAGANIGKYDFSYSQALQSIFTGEELLYGTHFEVYRNSQTNIWDAYYEELPIDQRWQYYLTTQTTGITVSEENIEQVWNKFIEYDNERIYYESLPWYEQAWVNTKCGIYSFVGGVLKVGGEVIDGVVTIGGSAVGGLVWLFDEESGNEILEGTESFVETEVVDYLYQCATYSNEEDAGFWKIPKYVANGNVHTTFDGIGQVGGNIVLMYAGGYSCPVGYIAAVSTAKGVGSSAEKRFQAHENGNDAGYWKAVGLSNLDGIIDGAVTTATYGNNGQIIRGLTKYKILQTGIKTSIQVGKEYAKSTVNYFDTGEYDWDATNKNALFAGSTQIANDYIISPMINNFTGRAEIRENANNSLSNNSVPVGFNASASNFSAVVYDAGGVYKNLVANDVIRRTGTSLFKKGVGSLKE